MTVAARTPSAAATNGESAAPPPLSVAAVTDMATYVEDHQLPHAGVVAWEKREQHGKSHNDHNGVYAPGFYYHRTRVRGR
jgi:hypothetical protein